MALSLSVTIRVISIPEGVMQLGSLDNHMGGYKRHAITMRNDMQWLLWQCWKIWRMEEFEESEFSETSKIYWPMMSGL
jgi:hypothetical protein